MPDAGEVARSRDRGGLAFRAPDHRRAERCVVLGMLVQMVEEGLPVDALEAGAAVHHGVEEPRRRRCVQLAARQGRATECRQARTDSGEREPVVLVLGEHVFGDEPTEHAAESVGPAPTASPSSLADRGPSARDSAMPSLTAR